MVGTIKDNDYHTDVDIETIKDQDHTDLDQVAADELGENPEHCLVFEDAPLGVAAGRLSSTSLSTSLPLSFSSSSSSQLSSPEPLVAK